MVRKLRERFQISANFLASPARCRAADGQSLVLRRVAARHLVDEAAYSS
jgi:hypothetical protein